MKQKMIRNTLFIIVIIIFLSTSGCIHIDLGNPFKSEEEKPPEYRIITKPGFPLKHTFNINDPWNPIESEKSQPFIVKKMTEWVNISINVVLNTFNFINVIHFIFE